jgi:hypothetical protein
MKYFIKQSVAVVCLSFLFLTGHSQQMASVIKAQALEMARAMGKKDFEKAATFLYPTLGEAAKKQLQAPGMMDSLNKAMEQFKPEITRITIGNPGPIVTHKKIMQALLPQEMEIKTTLLSVAFETTLVALSNDNGKKWYFAEANLYKNADAKTKLPELSPELVIPAAKPPKFIANKQQ